MIFVNYNCLNKTRWRYFPVFINGSIVVRADVGVVVPGPRDDDERSEQLLRCRITGPWLITVTLL